MEAENVLYSPWNEKKTWKFWVIAHGNRGRKDENHEFLWRLSNQVSMVTVAGNRPGNKKMCALAMKWAKNMKLSALAHRNGGWKHEKHEFLRRLSNQVSVFTVAGNCPRNRKLCAIAHEMGKNMKTMSYGPWKWRQKTWKSRVFAAPLKPSIDG